MSRVVIHPSKGIPDYSKTLSFYKAETALRAGLSTVFNFVLYKTTVNIINLYFLTPEKTDEDVLHSLGAW